MQENILAINGGNAIRTEPFPLRKLFGQEEKAAALALFDEAMEKGHQVLGYNGPQEEAYCKEFSEFMGGGFADGVNSGTNAVYVALRALELEPFTEVIVPAISDPGGVMPVALCNCIPIPADCAPGSYNLGAREIEARITDRTSAIIVAHIAGLPVDMDPIMELASGRGIPVIEDSAQAHGAVYKGKKVGTIGDIAAFSTMFGKHHASLGQGGIVFTKKEDIYWRIRRYADRGKPFGLEGADGNVVAALNCNMDEMHAAIGRVQLRKLSQMLERRRQLAKSIVAGCKRLKTIKLVQEQPDCESAYWFLFFKIDTSKLRVDKQTFVEAVQAEGIPMDPSYFSAPSKMPWYSNRSVFGTSELPWSSPQYKGDANKQFDLPNIEATDAEHFRTAVFHEDCTEKEVANILAALSKVEKAYIKYETAEVCTMESIA